MESVKEDCLFLEYKSNFNEGKIVQYLIYQCTVINENRSYIVEYLKTYYFKRRLNGL